MAAITATRGRACPAAELREAAERFYTSRLDEVPLDAEPAYCFDYNESVDGILAFLPTRADKNQ